MSLNKQRPWTIGKTVYASLMSLLLLGYLVVMATYCDPTTTGRTFVYPGFVWILRVITAIMALFLGKLWRDKGFRILIVYLFLKLVRVIGDGGDYVFTASVSESILMGFWVFTACYGLARIYSKEQLKGFLNVNVSIWILGMVVYSCLGVYAAWTGQYIYTIGKGAVWGLVESNRLFLVYFPTVSGSVLSLSFVLALGCIATARHTYVKILFFLSLLPILIGLCLTDSRTAQVTVSAGIALMTGIYVLRMLQKQARKKGKRDWYAWVTAIITAGIVFIVFVLLCMKTITLFNQVRANGLLIPRALAESSDEKAIVSNRGYSGNNLLTDRPMIWKSAIGVLMNNPLYLLWGTSIRNPMALVNASDTMTFSASHCHCMPLMILLENGIPGVLLIGAFLAKAAAASFRLVLNAENKRDIMLVPFVVSIMLGELIECFTWLRGGQCPTLPFFFVAIGIIMTRGCKQKPDSGI